MGLGKFLSAALGIGLVGLATKKYINRHTRSISSSSDNYLDYEEKEVENYWDRVNKEIEKRKNCIPNYNGLITKEQFSRIVDKSIKSIRRKINYRINGFIINGEVESQSGLSTWKFEIDLNDYGNLTGRHKITNGNSDSKIPEIILKKIFEEYECLGIYLKNEEFDIKFAV